MLYETKIKMQLSRTNIERHNIVGLVHYLWNKSFAHILSNKKATVHSGWNSLTDNLLDDPELMREKKTMIQ